MGVQDHEASLSLERLRYPFSLVNSTDSNSPLYLTLPLATYRRGGGGGGGGGRERAPRLLSWTTAKEESTPSPTRCSRLRRMYGKAERQKGKRTTR